MKWLLSAVVMAIAAFAWWLIRPLVADDATQGLLTLLDAAAGTLAGCAGLITWLLCDEAG